MRRLFAILVLFLAAAVLAAAPEARPLVPVTPDGFAVPRPGRVFSFPRDHGSHPEFRIEWWYITGHLFAGDGRRFGFQATFFRSAVPRQTGDADPAFGSSHLYLAHMALLDAEGGGFIHEERLNRDGWDARASTETLDLRNGNWSLQMTDTARETMRLQGSVRGEARLDLGLAPEKPRVLFGEGGVSRKGADETAASHYITFPRLEATGVLHLRGREFAVHGRAWMDHEISSSQLSAGQTGWDWCSMQLEDGWDLMGYRLRRDDGATDPFSTVAWISPEGEVTQFGPDAFRWEPLGTWTSPVTGARYPVSYRLVVRAPHGGADTVLEVRPVAPDQELGGGVGGIAYWEGACDVFDAAGRKIGRAFTELTGYAESLQGRF